MDGFLAILSVSPLLLMNLNRLYYHAWIREKSEGLVKRCFPHFAVWCLPSLSDLTAWVPHTPPPHPPASLWYLPDVFPITRLWIPAPAVVPGIELVSDKCLVIFCLWLSYTEWQLPGRDYMGLEGRSWECLWSWESCELEKHHQSLAEDLSQASPPTAHTTCPSYSPLRTEFCFFLNGSIC